MTTDHAQPDHCAYERGAGGGSHPVVSTCSREMGKNPMTTTQATNGNMQGGVGVKPTVLQPVRIDQATGTHYVTVDAQGVEHPISDFVMEPVARIRVNGDEAQTIYEVKIHDEVHQISGGRVLSSGPKFKAWCYERGLSWAGNNRDVDQLQVRLNNADVPTLYGVTVTGLHGAAFVQEGLTFGHDAEQFAYVRPVNYVARKTQIFPRESGWMLYVESAAWGDRAVIDWPRGSEPAWPVWDQGLRALARLHSPDVMTPILGWMAAAPLRSLFKMFPPLAVMGGAGWGKSTIVRTVMESFGYGTDALGLNGTTPYTIFSLASSTNALPVWFEEYRLGVRQDAKDAVNQLLRDAWEAGASVRGGTTENLSQVRAVRAEAPIVISGEDTFSESSHVQRILLVNMPKDGKDEQALTTIEGRYHSPDPNDIHEGMLIFAALQEFFSLYVEWLLFLKVNDLLPSPPNVHDRQAQGRAAACYGYDLLNEFATEIGVDPNVLPAWDESRVAAGQAEHVDLISELVLEALGVNDPADSLPIVWDTPDHDGGPGWRNVRVGAFVQWVARNRTDALPGGRKAISNYLKEKFGAVDHDYGKGNARRCVRWPLEDSAENPHFDRTLAAL